MLQNINIKAVYNSEEDNILEDFYIPVLSKSVSYDRAVGYFDAKMLVSAARGLSAFIKNEGYMRLICGATLAEDEYDAIAKGYGDRDIKARLEKDFYKIVKSNNSDLFRHQLSALTWMVKNYKLDVKIALRRYGIHHQKIGIFRDSKDNFIVFQGSANETKNALLPFNYETINVFKSWHPEFKNHYEPHMQSFESLWANQTKNTLVLNLSEISQKVLSETITSTLRPTVENEIMLWQQYLETNSIESKKINTPKIPQKINGHDFKLRSHQKTALKNWKQNNYRGLFELATGAGKTITAIYGAIKLWEKSKRLLVVVSVPYQNLAEQWAENLEVFNITPIICYGGETRWHEKLKDKILAFNTGSIDFCAVVVVNATLTAKKGTFASVIKSLNENLNDVFLFIGDECHHHGAEKTNMVLPQNAKLRIGLSATPDHNEESEDSEEDDDNKIVKYYGNIVSEYTLENALKDKILTPYEYYLLPIQLTTEEAEKYIDLSQKISRLYSATEKSKDKAEQKSRLLIKRARIINGAENKPKALKKLLSELTPIKHSLFYCAEGKTNNEAGRDEDEEGLKQIQLISSILHNQGWRSHQFTANEKKAEREDILKSFKNGDVHSLVAMKCLDEGVDIPVCNTAFILSSSRNKRQFIQRRGRILRKSQGKEKAVIYDFLTTLPPESNKETARRLLKAELKRVKEFASLSLNKTVAYEKMEPYLKRYDLYHHL